MWKRVLPVIGAILVLALWGLGQPTPIVQTTAFTRLLLKAVDAASARTMLGVGPGGLMAVDDLTDVDLNAPGDGQALVYHAASGNWTNGTVAGGPGGGLNGVGTNGQVAMWTGTNTLGSTMLPLSGFQPADADLTNWAALATTAVQAASAGLTNLSSYTAASFQPADADLTNLAATPGMYQVASAWLTNLASGGLAGIGTNGQIPIWTGTNTLGSTMVGVDNWHHTNAALTVWQSHSPTDFQATNANLTSLAASSLVADSGVITNDFSIGGTMSAATMSVGTLTLTNGSGLLWGVGTNAQIPLWTGTNTLGSTMLGLSGFQPADSDLTNWAALATSDVQPASPGLTNLSSFTGASFQPASDVLTNLAAGGLPVQFSWTIGDGVNLIVNGAKDVVYVGAACTITNWIIVAADAASTVTCGLWWTNYTGFPPGSAGTMTASDHPLLSASQRNQGIPTTWVHTNFDAGDWLRLSVTNTDAKLIKVILYGHAI